ncbi:uncharacterized protein N7484_006818 [Penicillium longicatenatum]|uniref:uncharacterized protein n=1 Tax=Penicillium longicatenatum TaxID=1561947 RepID=UPI002547B55A|nr:uncharacterized protein N7484_006818 [Penicillium longicatenatum]KAJ5638956.1 hypothetical protein N7484_006818 [Penicillium longicatenatum]
MTCRPAEEVLILSQTTCQAVSSLYLDTLTRGFATTHDSHCTNDALHYRGPSSYGYARSFVGTHVHRIFDVKVGQFCIFNSQDMHEVAAIEYPNAPRIVLAGQAAPV